MHFQPSDCEETGNNQQSRKFLQMVLKGPPAPVFKPLLICSGQSYHTMNRQIFTWNWLLGKQQGLGWKEINFERSQICQIAQTKQNKTKQIPNSKWAAAFFVLQSKLEGGGVLVLLKKITSHQNFPLIILPAVRSWAAVEEYKVRLKDRESSNSGMCPQSSGCQPQSPLTFTKPGLVCREHPGTLHHLKCNLGSRVWWSCR